MSADDLRARVSAAFAVLSRRRASSASRTRTTAPAASITPLGELRGDSRRRARAGRSRSTWTARASGTRASRAACRSPNSRRCADTVMVAFSKGLGAPIGAALAGTREAMERAWTARKLFGGAMRQSGILAAAVLYALDHHLERLADDHANARDAGARSSTVPAERRSSRPIRTSSWSISFAGLGEHRRGARSAACSSPNGRRRESGW